MSAGGPSSSSPSMVTMIITTTGGGSNFICQTPSSSSSSYIRKKKLRWQFVRPLTNGFADEWKWNESDRSEACRISERHPGTAHFHIGWSSGTAGCRATKPVNLYRDVKYYWEVVLKDKVFGTSMMIGLTTKAARLHSNSYINLIGENRHGWGLSHKGLIWHNGQWKEYTKPFRENCTTIIGCLYDGHQGTLTYYKDGECLGVAFHGLNLIQENLYPTISSTAAQSQFVLTFVRRQYLNLQDRCREIIRRYYRLDDDHPMENYEKKNYLYQILPKRIMSYLTLEDELFEMKRKEFSNSIHSHHHEQPEVKLKRIKPPPPIPDF